MNTFTLDGRTISLPQEGTLLDAARTAGIDLPHLCAMKVGETQHGGNCRACLVEIEGERVLAPACLRRPVAGQVVRTDSPRARAARDAVLAMLTTENPAARHVYLPPGTHAVAATTDTSHPSIRFTPEACIKCVRCVIACREVQGNDVLGLAFSGGAVRVVFDQGAAVRESSCVACGECVAACPTGALHSPGVARGEVRDTLCPWCGVGCQMRLSVGDDVVVSGRDGPANAGRLCVKGRYGMDYLRHPDRLTVPLVRRDGVGKRDAPLAREAWQAVFRPASWDEALHLAAQGLMSERDAFGPGSVGGLGSAKGSNEEAYLFQKLMRAGLGTHNVDHCARLCHSPSVAALLEAVGCGAVSNPIRDVRYASVIMVIGADPTRNHPVGATWIKNAVKAGATLMVIDPQPTGLDRFARHVLRHAPGTDVLLINALIHVVIHEGLAARDFVAARVEGFEALVDATKAYPPERVAGSCLVSAERLREVARCYARAPSAMIFWGMGLTQHIHGTDNVRAVIALCLICGQIGRPGSGLHPLRGQNNVQGASDAGLLPNMRPDYARVISPHDRARFEHAWGTRLPAEPGLTAVEMIQAAGRGELRALYVMGENLALSDPDSNQVWAALARLPFMVVQDIFLTETASFADVVLPAAALAEKTGSYTNTDRTVQIAHGVCQPPGQAQPDSWILQQLAQHLGLGWVVREPGTVFDEMRALMPSLGGVSWARLRHEGAVTHPCHRENAPGEAVLFTERFHTENGRAKLTPVSPRHAAELPDADYPLVLITGRLLEHWHTGAMSGRARVLTALQPLQDAAFARFSSADLAAAGVREGERVRLVSRRGAVELVAQCEPAGAPGVVFMPFCFAQSAANLLTGAHLDPLAKIPEYKFSAVRLERCRAGHSSDAAGG